MARRGALMLSLAVIAGALPGAAPAQNRQPISTSMVECSAIFHEFAVLGERRGRDPADIDLAMAGSDRFRKAAVEQARAEGVADPVDHVAQVGVDMTGKWRDRFGQVLLLSENMDWVKYCGALGRDRGLLPVRD